MKFSIIIATHNAGKTLEETLNSIVSQTFKDFEALIIDAGSDDNTSKIVKRFSRSLGNRLQWVSEPDEGVYDAMNKGIASAKGEYLYFLGSGDVLYDKKVLETVNQETAEPVDVIYGDIKWGKTNNVYDGKFTKYKLITKNICHQAIFYNKRIFNKYGVYDNHYKILADYVFNMKWFNDRSVKRKYINNVIATYDISGLSATSKDEVFLRERWKILFKFFPFYIVLTYIILSALKKSYHFLRYIFRGDIKGLMKRIKNEN